MLKSEMLKLRVQPEEKEAFEIAADLAGIPLSAWIRERLRKSARYELEEAGRQIPFVQIHRKSKVDPATCEHDRCICGDAPPMVRSMLAAMQTKRQTA